MTVRLLQVGLGPWGRSWAAGVLPEATGVDVVGYVDKDPAANEDLGARLFFTDLDEALATTDPDAVLGTIAINAHTPVALQVLRAGKHLLLEKPFAPTLVSASATIEFDGGTMLTYAASLASRGPDTPWAGEWHLDCEGGEIVMSSRADDHGTTDFVEVRPVDGEPYRPELPVLERTDRAGVLASFVDAVENGAEPSSPAADNLRSVALMDAALRSSASGAFVPVDHGS